MRTAPSSFCSKGEGDGGFREGSGSLRDAQPAGETIAARERFCRTGPARTETKGEGSRQHRKEERKDVEALYL